MCMERILIANCETHSPCQSWLFACSGSSSTFKLTGFSAGAAGSLRRKIKHLSPLFHLDDYACGWKNKKIRITPLSVWVYMRQSSWKTQTQKEHVCGKDSFVDCETHSPCQTRFFACSRSSSTFKLTGFSEGAAGSLRRKNKHLSPLFHLDDYACGWKN